jgi:mannosyltransferase
LARLSQHPLLPAERAPRQPTSGTRLPEEVRPAAPPVDRLIVSAGRRHRFFAPYLPKVTWARAGVAVAAVVVIAGTVGRFLAPSGLWLDEALSVNISKLTLLKLPGALLQDGSPPLYYLVLHYWMLVFGQGDFAVRALSGIFSVATLPLLWFAGRRLGGRRMAWAALLLGASSPWAIYYATDTRPYSLMALEAVAWYLAVVRAVEQPSRRRLVVLGVLTAALMYTHYWDLYLVAVGGAWVLWRWGRESWPPGTDLRSASGTDLRSASGALRKVFWAMCGGVLLWLPWSPVFVYQVRHTGTPWSSPPGPENLLGVFSFFAGPGGWGALLTYVLFILVGFALFARVGPKASSVVVELRVQPRAREIGLLVVGTLSLALAAGMVTGAAFDSRYIAVVFPLFVLLCSLGLTTFASPKVTSGILAVACMAGLFSAQLQGSQPRTQAVQVADVLNVEAQPGDVVVYCPDQLGPAVSRLLGVPRVTQLTFPRMTGPERVDWVNYVSVISHTDVGTFAQEVFSQLSPQNTLWLVWRDGYKGFGHDCGNLASWFQMWRPGGELVIKANSHYYEYENLEQFRS